MASEVTAVASGCGWEPHETEGTQEGLFPICVPVDTFYTSLSGVYTVCLGKITFPSDLLVQELGRSPCP